MDFSELLSGETNRIALAALEYEPHNSPEDFWTTYNIRINIFRFYMQMIEPDKVKAEEMAQTFGALLKANEKVNETYEQS